MYTEAPFFSVIIPTSNRPKLLLRTLNRIKDQTFENYEVLIINNGTRPEMFDDYKQVENKFGSRFLFYNYLNNDAQGFGPSAARNIGVQKAVGQYIAFCDDDDEWVDINYLYDAKNIIDEYKPQLLLSDQVAVASASEDQAHTKNTWFPDVEKYTLLCKDRLFKFSSYNYFTDYGLFPHLNISIYERHWLLELGLFNKSLWYEEDLELFLKALQAKAAIYFNQKVVAKHYIPNKILNLNVTSLVDEQEKYLKRYLLTMALLNQHGLRGASGLLITLASNSAKHLTQIALNNCDYRLAKLYATSALMIRPTLKWRCYTWYLVVLALFRGN